MNFKKKLIKKRKGSLVKLLIPLVMMLGFAFIMVVGLDSVTTYAKKLQIDGIARDYLLKMERNGCLSAELENKLVKELNDIKITGISTIGSTTTNIGYGNDVFLVFKGYTIKNKYTIKNNWNLEKVEEIIPVSRSVHSTAKN